jgi:FG-GAP-like repeat
MAHLSHAGGGIFDSRCIMFRDSLSAVLLGILACCATASAQVTFTQTALNSGDTASTSIVSADFNNDGILDLVTINASSLSFYKGLGTKFASAVPQTIPQGLGQVLAGDFNRDGRLDLAVATACCDVAGNVIIFTGNGDGTFKQGQTISSTGTGAFIALADFNGDHLPDLAVSIYGGGSEVFLGQGDGTFKDSASLAYGGSQIVAGDFNADGHQDVAVIAPSDVALYLGNGNGTFQNPLLAPLAAVVSIAVGDFYNNRIQSLAALVSTYGGSGNFENDLFTLRYKNGTFVAENENVISASTGIPYQRVIGGDLDGDFKDDIFLVGGNFQGSAVSAYMLGNGDGTFKSLVDAPHWMDLQDFPFIRDLDLDGRHDVGIAWTSIFENFGGAEALRNTSATVNCKPPAANALTVHICAPTSNQVVGKTFTFRAAGNAWNGIAKRMELWIDGKKVGQNLEDQLKVTTTLTRGTHTASFVVVDSFDNYVTQSATFSASY